MFREHALWGRAEGAGVVKRRTLRGNVITLYNYLERGVGRWGLVSSTVPAVRGPEKMALSWGKRFRWDIRKNIFTVSLVRHWNRLPREVVVTSPGSIEKVYWSHTGWWFSDSGVTEVVLGWWLDVMMVKFSSNLNDSMILWVLGFIYSYLDFL